MPRKHPEHLALQYQAIDSFVERVLRRQDSMFTPGRQIWSSQHIEELFHRFVENPDTSADSFENKLKKQLEGATPETIQLAAELMFIHLITGDSTKGDTKRRLVNNILNLSPNPVGLPPELGQALDVGLAAEGMAYTIFRYFLMQYLLGFIRKWWSLSQTERDEALGDPWAFKAVAVSALVPKSRSQMEILLHMVHPDSFEAIMSADHKKRIAEALAKDNEKHIGDIDRQLHAIRQRLTPEFGKDFTFYNDHSITTSC